MFDVCFIDIPTLPFEIAPDYARLLSDSCAIQDEVFLRKSQKRRNPRKHFYSPGILCLATYLKERGITCKYINYELDRLCIANIARSARFFAFSTLTITYDLIVSISEELKKTNPEAKIVLGGYHSNYFARDTLTHNSCIDAVILGEGEEPLFAYVSGVPLDEIDGIAYRKDSGVIIRSDHELLRADHIPLPDYSILEGKLGEYNINVGTMRGCSGRCKFCVNPDYWGKPRLIPIEKVMKEFEYLSTHCAQGEKIYITDNVFSFSKPRFLALCQAIEPYCKGLTICCDIKAGFFDSEIAKAMKSINVSQISIGFEDCDDDVLKLSSKGVSFEDNVRTAMQIQKFLPNVIVYAYWLVGLPGCSRKSIYKNVKCIPQLIKKGIIDSVSAKLFIPYPGTEFFTHPEQYGLKLIDIPWRYYERKNTPLPYQYIDSDISEDDLFLALQQMISRCMDAAAKRFNIDLTSLASPPPNDLPFMVKRDNTDDTVS
ncbi:MAG: radical SAM protein [Candidatus Limiplasma sp.]|nr:radical SAM protein [Candidatus Limiplasma sp.]